MVIIILVTGCSDDSVREAGVQKIEKSNNNIKISSNKAYGVASGDEGVEEIIYNYPQMNSDDSTIEAQQNEAYATSIVTQRNEAYATSINPVM